MSDSGTPTPPIRVVVVDDQAIVRGGLRMILDAQPDIEVVGEAENGKAGVELVAELDDLLDRPS